MHVLFFTLNHPEDERLKKNKRTVDIAEFFVVFEGDDGVGEVVEVSAEDV